VNFLSFYRCPSHWKFVKKNTHTQENNNLSFTCEEGSQKVFVQIVKSKIPLKENATEGVKFYSWVKVVVLLLHLAMSTTIYENSWHTYTEPTFKGSYQMCNCRWVVVVVVVGVEEHGALKRTRLLVSCKSSSCSWTVPQSSSLWYEQDLPRTRRRSKSFQTHNNKQQQQHHHQQQQSSVVQHHLDDSRLLS
jgi:hypothetical protein